MGVRVPPFAPTTTSLITPFYAIGIQRAPAFMDKFVVTREELAQIPEQPLFPATPASAAIPVSGGF